MPQLVSVNVGVPQDISWHGETIRTAVWKTPVQGSRMVRRLNIDGDRQGDLAGHGGEQRAVFVYQRESYDYWEHFLGRNDFVMGQFGENFTITGLSDEDVCIGDRYRIGGTLFEVTQPRVTCYRVGIRMSLPEMPSLLIAHHRPGFYLRVLQEGEVEAGNKIIKVTSGPEQMSVAEVSALLYLSHHSHEQLERALRIPALSPGWQASFQALLTQMDSGSAVGGNAGLSSTASAPPAWKGFRSLKVAHIVRESESVLSLSLVPTDEQPLASPLPGQFVVLRILLQPDVLPLMRNYSLSGLPNTQTYRVSVKQEFHGQASSYIHSHVQEGDVLEVSAPRGTFVCKADEAGPIVFLSAGVGATPVLAMLYALAEASSPREIWWLYGARNGCEHPFAHEVQSLLAKLLASHSYIRYSRPEPQDLEAHTFDSVGHLDIPLLETLGVPREAAFYLCGPATFLEELTTSLKSWGVVPSTIHAETFGAGPSLTPGINATSQRSPHQPEHSAGTGPVVSFARSALTVHWDSTAFHSLLELAEACDVPVRWSCRTGVCHTCESGLISGRVTYNPEPLDPPAEGNLLLCCAQPLDELVLDL